MFYIFKAISLSIYQPHLYPFICWQTLSLFPYVGYYEYCCNKHGKADVSSRPYFNLLQTYTQKWKCCWHIWQFYFYFIFLGNCTLFSIVAVTVYTLIIPFPPQPHQHLSRQRQHKKRKLQANITNEHRCKNSQQNFRQQNSATHQKAHIPWSSCVYSRDARILQYMEINQCDTPY